MAVIYHKAVDEAGGENIEESDFKYPGPKPKTPEAGIVMLADLVEAASRTIQERSPGRLKTLINTIIQKRFMEGELDESWRQPKYEGSPCQHGRWRERLGILSPLAPARQLGPESWQRYPAAAR